MIGLRNGWGWVGGGWLVLPAALLAAACSSDGNSSAASANAGTGPTNTQVETTAGSGGAPVDAHSDGTAGKSFVDGESDPIWECSEEKAKTGNDPDNCGSCGHGCGAIELASGQRYPNRITVDARNVYWTTRGNPYDGTVMQMPLEGGTPIVLATGQIPNDIAVDATHVYWANGNDDGAIKSVPIGGGEITTLSAHEHGPIAIAVDETNVYWSTLSGTPCPEDEVDCSPSGTVMQMPLAGGDPITLASGQPGPAGIAIDATSVYWANNANNIFEGEVMKVAIGGGTPISLASHQSGVAGGIALAGESVYFTGHLGANSLRMVSKDGGAVTSLLSEDANGAAVATNATGAYWIAHGLPAGSASLLQQSFAGDEPKVLLLRSAATDVAVSGTDVYWTDGASDGSIMKLGATSCLEGVCGCPANQVPCFGTCSDLNSDASNCGACGTACAADSACHDGICSP